MSPLLTGLAKLTREELDALMVEHDRLKRYERERVVSRFEDLLDGLNNHDALEAGRVRSLVQLFREEA